MIWFCLLLWLYDTIVQVHNQDGMFHKIPLHKYNEFCTFYTIAQCKYLLYNENNKIGGIIGLWT